MVIMIRPHNPAWKLQFQVTKAHLETILQHVEIITIKHVSSTAIPDLVAKPIIDIDIVVKSQHLYSARHAMKSGGYEDRGNLGVPRRIAFRALNSSEHEAVFHKSNIRYKNCKENIYVVVEDCVSLKNHLDLRRVLLSNAELRDEYGAVKEKLVAEGVNDVDEYCKGKNEIILKILRSAGWSEDELEEVRLANM